MVLHTATVIYALIELIRVSIVAVMSSTTGSVVVSTGIVVSMSPAGTRTPAPSLLERTDERGFSRIIDIVTEILR